MRMRKHLCLHCIFSLPLLAAEGPVPEHAVMEGRLMGVVEPSSVNMTVP